jgi:hypothetical protein
MHQHLKKISVQPAISINTGNDYVRVFFQKGFVGVVPISGKTVFVIAVHKKGMQERSGLFYRINNQYSCIGQFRGNAMIKRQYTLRA